MTATVTAPSTREAAPASTPTQPRPSYLWSFLWGLAGAAASARTARKRGYTDTAAYWWIGGIVTAAWLPLLVGLAALSLAVVKAPTTHAITPSPANSVAAPTSVAPATVGTTSGNTAPALMDLFVQEHPEALGYHIDAVTVALGGEQGGFKTVGTDFDLGQYPGVQITYTTSTGHHYANFARVGDGTQNSWKLDDQG